MSSFANFFCRADGPCRSASQSREIRRPREQEAQIGSRRTEVFDGCKLDRYFAAIASHSSAAAFRLRKRYGRAPQIRWPSEARRVPRPGQRLLPISLVFDRCSRSSPRGRRLVGANELATRDETRNILRVLVVWFYGVGLAARAAAAELRETIRSGGSPVPVAPDLAVSAAADPPPQAPAHQIRQRTWRRTPAGRFPTGANLGCDWNLRCDR